MSDAANPIAQTDDDNGRLDQIKSQAKDAYDSLKHRAQERYEMASERVADTVARVRSTNLSDVQETTQSYVRENPGKSVAMAAGVGFVLGVLIGRVLR